MAEEEDAGGVVSDGCIHELLEVFSRGSYKARNSLDRRNEIIHKRCIHLVARDYDVEVIDNKAGQLCGHYPSELIVIERKKPPSAGETNSSAAHSQSRQVNCTVQLKELISTARYARCRSRFVVPVILFENKNICRSATLSTMAEMYGRTGMDWITVASSEKVDKWARYSDFQIASMPYPGCEFFREYKDNSFNAVGLHFDWKQSMIDADLLVPELLQRMTQIPFGSYQEWDLVQITLNYLKLFLTYLKNGEGGLLIHCISGWDRTPLFISLLRLSLWADGRVHSSLSPKEILYLTLAYDWFAFGHPFKDRRDRGEEIMFFCFDFLKNITSDELSINSEDTCTSATGVPHQSSLHHNHTHYSELGDSWVVEGVTHEERNQLYTPNTALPGHHCEPWGSSVNHTFSSQSHSSALCHLGSFPRTQSSCSNHSASSVPRNHSYSTTSLPPTVSPRHHRLLAVRTIFQKAYRTALPDLVPTQGAMAFASGLLSRLPLFGSSSNTSDDTHV